MGEIIPTRVIGKEAYMSSNEEIVIKELTLQKSVTDWENVITQNLDNLARALMTAADGRLMSHEHAKIIWKSYLSVSGMDIPKELKSKVLQIIEEEKSSSK